MYNAFKNLAYGRTPYDFTPDNSSDDSSDGSPSSSDGSPNSSNGSPTSSDGSPSSSNGSPESFNTPEKNSRFNLLGRIPYDADFRHVSGNKYFTVENNEVRIKQLRRNQNGRVNLSNVRFPPHMTSLVSDFVPIKYFPDLDKFYNLKKFRCKFSQVTELPKLPPQLQLLICSRNIITKLPDLPPQLRALNCMYNKITELPVLPSQLTEIDCGYNKLSSIPKLPPQLVILHCGNNKIRELPELPITLEELTCDNNLISELPDLPPELTHIDFNNNPLQALPSIPISLSPILSQTGTGAFFNIIFYLVQNSEEFHQMLKTKYPLLGSVFEENTFVLPAIISALSDFSYNPDMPANPHYKYNGRYIKQELLLGPSLNDNLFRVDYCTINYINYMNYMNYLKLHKNKVALLNTNNTLNQTVQEDYARRVWHPRYMAPLLENPNTNVEEFNREREKHLGGGRRRRRVRKSRRRRHTRARRSRRRRY